MSDRVAVVAVPEPDESEPGEPIIPLSDAPDGTDAHNGITHFVRPGDLIVTTVTRWDGTTGQSLEAAVREWLTQVGDCDLGPRCNCVGHDGLLIMQIEMALTAAAAVATRQENPT